MKQLLTILFFTLFFFLSYGQEEDTLFQSKIYVENANSSVQDLSGADLVRYLNGDVRMYKDSVFMFCDSARMIGNKVTALGNVVFVQADTVKMFCDSLVYFSDIEKVYLYKDVTLENGDQQLYTQSMIYDVSNKIGTFQDTAILKKDLSLLQSKKGRYDVNNKISTFYEDVIVTKEDMSLRTDSLKYLTEENKTIFIAPTRIVENERKIYCEAGFYNLDSGEAEFSGNPQLLELEKNATASKILYSQNDSTLTLIDNARFIDGEKIAIGDTIIHNNKIKETQLIGEAQFIDGDKITKGEKIIYNEKTESVQLDGQATYREGSTVLDADRLIFDDLTGRGQGSGNVIWKDTSSNITMIADQLRMDKNDESLFSYGEEQRPYVINMLDGDSLYLAGDTLQSFQEIVTDTLGVSDTSRIFTARGGVDILKTDFKAICDSLSFNERDSIFKLYKNPIVWSDTTQFSGDTIFMYLKNKKVDHLEIRKNAFIVSRLEAETYDQIKGRYVDARFVDGEIAEMDVVGNAESLYYMRDDEEKYIGVNKTLCSKMTFYFEEKELMDIKFYSKPESVLTPIQKINPITQRLELFNWQIDKAPINLLSIIAMDK